jgi:hypothetical protein
VLASAPQDSALRYEAGQNAFAGGDYAQAESLLGAAHAHPEGLSTRQRRRALAIREVALAQLAQTRARSP